MGDKGPVFLHIGAPKTGTTYVQTVLDAASDDLRQAGVLFPAGKRGQQRAVRDLLNHGSPRARRQRRGAWQLMLRTVDAWPGSVVISNETLALRLRPKRAGRVAAGFGAREVHVVYTARDLVRQLPACWQESLKNRATTTFAEYFTTVSGPQPPRLSVTGERIWAAQEAAVVLEPWVAAVGPRRVHIVTVPPRGAPSDILLSRLGSVLGVDLSPHAAVTSEPNVSLDATEAAVLRLLNLELAALETPLPWSDYVSLVKRFLANHVFPDRQGRTPLWLTPEQAQWAMAESDRTARAIADGGYHVVGDLTDLVPPAPGVPISSADVDNPSLSEQRDVAVAALARLLGARSG